MNVDHQWARISVLKSIDTNVRICYTEHTFEKLSSFCRTCFDRFLFDSMLHYSFRRCAMEHKIYKSYDELPLMLSVQDVADVLGISISGSYELVKEKGFPRLKIGARIVVPKEKFIRWVEDNS